MTGSVVGNLIDSVSLVVIPVIILRCLFLEWENRLKKKKQKQQDEKIKSVIRRTFISITNLIIARHPATGKHSRRVAVNAFYVGRFLGIAESELGMLYWAAFLHDVGKIALSDDLLASKHALSKDEQSLFRLHPKIGARMLNFLPVENSVIRTTILQHHERWQGGGYPAGISGETIHIFARIISVVNVFDRLTGLHPCKKEMLPDQAIKYIRKKGEIDFDPVVVDAFIRAYDSGHIVTTRSTRDDLMIVPFIDETLLKRLTTEFPLVP